MLSRLQIYRHTFPELLLTIRPDRGLSWERDRAGERYGDKNHKTKKGRPSWCSYTQQVPHVEPV